MKDLILLTDEQKDKFLYSELNGLLKYVEILSRPWASFHFNNIS